MLLSLLTALGYTTEGPRTHNSIHQGPMKGDSGQSRQGESEGERAGERRGGMVKLTVLG